MSCDQPLFHVGDQFENTVVNVNDCDYNCNILSGKNR